MVQCVNVHVHYLAVHVHFVAVHVHYVVVHVHYLAVHVHYLAVHVHYVAVHVHYVAVHVHYVALHGTTRCCTCTVYDRPETRASDHLRHAISSEQINTYYFHVASFRIDPKCQYYTGQ